MSQTHDDDQIWWLYNSNWKGKEVQYIPIWHETETSELWIISHLKVEMPGTFRPASDEFLLCALFASPADRVRVSTVDFTLISPDVRVTSLLGEPSFQTG